MRQRVNAGAEPGFAPAPLQESCAHATITRFAGSPAHALSASSRAAVAVVVSGFSPAHAITPSGRTFSLRTAR